MVRILTFFLLLGLSATGFTQSMQEIEAVRHLNHQHEHQHDWSSYLKKSESEFQLLFSGMFLTYKSFLSSQDASNCSFYPSCSVYAIEAVRKQGPIVGIINTFDRLSRCNGMSPELYPRHPDTHLLYDPL